MATPTTRTRTVTAAGSFAGTSEVQFVVPMGAPYWSKNFFLVEFEFLGCVVRLSSRTYVWNSAATNQKQYLDLVCYTGLGFGVGNSDTDFAEHTFDTTIPASLLWTEVLAGSWEITGHMEEVLDVTGSGYPTYGGAEVPDPPNTSFVDFLDRLVLGSTLTVSASVAGMSVSASVVVDAARQTASATQQYPFRFEIIAEGRGKLANDIGLFNTTLNLGGSNAELSGSYGEYRTDHYATVDGASGKIYARAGEFGKKVRLQGVLYPVQEIDFALALRAMEDSYPNTADFRVDKKLTELAALAVMGDGATLALRQEKHSFGASFWQYPGVFAYDAIPVDQDDPVNPKPTQEVLPAPVGVSVNERTPLRLWLDSDWIATQGEQQGDWRVLLRGRPYSSFTLTQASEAIVSSTLASGTGASDLTIALPAGTTAAALRGTSFYGASLRGYRYLRVRMKASVGETVTVTIGAKSWNADKNGAALTLTTSYQNFDLDLCSPTNQTASVDDTDTFFPLPTVDGEYFGVSAASSIVIGSITAGVTVDVESVKVVRDAYSRATFLQPFPGQWIPAGDTSEYPVRFVDGDTDGRRSLEGIHFYRPSGGGTPVIRGLTDLISSLNGAVGTYPSDGWTATAAGSFPDAYHTNSLPACFAWGAGALYRAAAWSYGFDRDMSAVVTVYAQALWDSVSVPPLWGDGFWYVDGGYSGPGQVKAAKILRSQVVGLVFGDDSLPESGVTVSVEGGADGSGVTQANGSYQTGLPYPKGGPIVDVEAEAGSEPFPSGSVVSVARRRERICFRVTNAPAGSGFVYNDWHGQTHATSVTADGLRYYRSDTSLPLPVWAVNGNLITVDAEGRAPLVLDWRERIIVLIEFSGNIYESVSDDDGATWSTPAVAIAGATHPFIMADESGNLLETGYVGGNVKGRFRAPGDIAWSSEFTFSDSASSPISVENESYALTVAKDTPNRYLWTARKSGGANTTLFWSADEGRTWTEIP